MALLVLLRAAPTVTWLGGCTLLPAKAGPLLQRPGCVVRPAVRTGLVLIGFGLVVATTAD
ncbi:hypothetical protein [Streptomyces sp. NPDC001135]